MTNVKAAQSRRTRVALMDVGRELFAERGYSAVSAEAIVEAAGVTRGALYHHYEGKPGLFRSVVEAVMVEMKELVGRAADGAESPLQAVERGIHAYLDVCSEPAIRQIVLIDGPAVLGWHTWRALDLANGLGLLREGILSAVRAGQIHVSDLDTMTNLLGGALVDAALLVADRPEPEVRSRIETSLVSLVRGLAAPAADLAR